MKHIVVSLVGEQTIPNILAIHHFQPDELLFVSTSKMEKKNKTGHILTCLAKMGMDYSQKYQTLEIREDSHYDCRQKLDEWIIGRDDNTFTVNLTGGTKTMALFAYEYFKDLESRKMVYIPFPRNEFITPFSKRAVNQPTPLTLRLKVADYLVAYGLSIINEEKLQEIVNEAQARRDLSRWMVWHYDKIKNLLVYLGGGLRAWRNNKKEFIFSGSFTGATAEEKELLSRLKISYAGNAFEKSFSRSDILFLTGGWLEEYCFNEIYSLVGVCVDDAVTGIQIKNEKGTENEFDVIFTAGNALYTVECKSLDQEGDKKAEVLYKIGALKKDFGLNAKGFFVSTSPHILDKDGSLKLAVDARAEQFETMVITERELKDFAQKVKDKLQSG